MKSIEFYDTKLATQATAIKRLESELDAAEKALSWYGTIAPITDSDVDKFQERHLVAICKAEARFPDEGL